QQQREHHGHDDRDEDHRRTARSASDWSHLGVPESHGHHLPHRLPHVSPERTGAEPGVCRSAPAPVRPRSSSAGARTVRPVQDWPEEVARRSRTALQAVAAPVRAPVMAAYMRDVAPFLGVRAGPRRAALRATWKDLPPPTSEELGLAARALMALPERELHY